MPVAVRSLTAQPLNLKMWLVIIALASLPIPLFVDGADQIGQRIVFGSLVCLIIDIAVAFEAGHLARRERLYSAWFLMMLYIPTALIFALRAFAAHRGYIGPGDLFGGLGVLHGWLALFAVVFILLRSIAVVLIAAERGRRGGPFLIGLSSPIQMWFLSLCCEPCFATFLSRFLTLKRIA